MNLDNNFPIKMDTHALGIEFQEEAMLVESAARRKEGEIQKQKSAERNNQMRKAIVQQCFLRMSNFKKKEFLINLLQNVRSADSVMHIMHFMPIGYAKGYNYSTVDHTIGFIYEKGVADHNRMLDEKALDQTIANDLEWFRTLPDPNQVLLFIDLLRHGGGYSRRTIAVPLLIAYFQRMKSRREVVQGPSSDQVKKVQIKNSVSEIADNTIIDDEDPFDPTHPSSIEVEKLIKKWNEIIAKYKKEVEAGERKLESRFESDKKGTDAKSSKSAKSKESKKSSKKGKKVEEEIDRIQSVPVWIIKKIFGYLDQKTLKKMKVVNSYWAYIIQDFLTDMKMRKKLDKAVDKLKKQIDPTKLKEELSAAPVIKETKIYRSKRVRNKNDCGVTTKEIIPTRTDEVMEKSLITEVENEIYVEKECMSVSFKPLLSFPRVDKDELFHRQTPCILRDVNVVLGVEDGKEKHVSFLTYSLSSRLTSTMSFDVEKESLAGW